MRIKLRILSVFFLILGFFLFNTCTRNEVEEPSPVGPSTFSIILDLTLSPNVLTAGESRDICQISASLKKYDGVPISGKDIHFEIGDSEGNKINMGYFEGNKSVQTVTTNGNGLAKVKYYGPTAEELSGDISLYIYARASWEGKEFISNAAKLQIIQDMEVATFSLAADPNVLFAGESPEKSTITGVLKTTSDIALSGEKVHFEITDGTGTKVNLGYFEGNEPVITKTTDEQGRVEVDYFGPVSDEITENTTLYIRATVGWEGASEEEIIEATAAIQIIADSDDIYIDVSASPNVLFAGTYREKSTITATATQAGNKPVANKTLYFEITDENGNRLDLGYFEGEKSVKEKTTDNTGTAETVYYGPIAQEISENTTIYIKAWLAGEGEESSTGTTSVSILRDAPDLSLDLIAEPYVLLCGDQNPTSTIKAYFKKGSTLLPDRKIYFQITSGSGEFTNGKTTAVALTDEEGIATVTYRGPTKDDMTDDETVTIEAQPQTSSLYNITETVELTLIKEEEAEYSLELIADPSTVICGDTSSDSEIRAKLKQGTSPVSGETVLFQITSGEGSFDDTDDVYSIEATTDSEGIAKVTYWGPTNTEISEDSTATIEAQVEISEFEVLTAEVELTLVYKD
ncbi:hypothetical protein KGY73_03230 [bacterium]|nr:hypothetical protein [bacterium]